MVWSDERWDMKNRVSDLNRIDTIVTNTLAYQNKNGYFQIDVDYFSLQTGRAGRIGWQFNTREPTEIIFLPQNLSISILFM